MSSQLSIFNSLATDSDPVCQALRELPKVDLHAHLSGCLRLATVQELVNQYSLDVPETARRDLAAALVFQSPARTYSASFQPWKQVLNRVMEVPDIIPRLILEVAEDFAADGVVYAELRVSPRIPLLNGELDHFLQSIHQALTAAREQLSIDLRIILGFTRHSFYHLSEQVQNESVDKILVAAEPYRGHTVVGFDLWGDENRHPPRAFERIFKRIRDAKYPLTIHAGEVYSSSFIRDAVERLGCQRLGHATAIPKDPTLFTLLRNRQILVEVCLTSNRLTRVVDDLERHPIRHMIAHGVPVTLCTDNTLVYGTSLSKEVATALQLGLIDAGSVGSIFSSAVTWAFADSRCIETLRSRIVKAYTAERLDQLARLVAMRARPLGYHTI